MPERVHTCSYEGGGGPHPLFREDEDHPRKALRSREPKNGPGSQPPPTAMPDVRVRGILKKLLQHAPNLTLNMIEGRVRITYRELEASKRQVIDGSAQVLVATGGGGSGGQGSFPGPSPGHYTGGRGGTASGGDTGHWGQQQQQHHPQQQQYQEPNQHQPPRQPQQQHQHDQG